MKTEAKKLADIGQNVLIIYIARRDEVKDPLLVLEAIEEFKDQPKVTVKSVVMKNGEECGLEALGQGFDHVMIDELYFDFPAMSKINHREFKNFVSSKKTVWIAMSSQYFDDPSRMIFKVSSQHDDIVKTTYEDFFKGIRPDIEVICEMNTPMRGTLKLTEQLRFAEPTVWTTSGSTQFHLSHIFSLRMDLSKNLLEGLNKEKIDCDPKGSLAEALKCAWEKVPRSKRNPKPRVLFVNDYFR